MKDARWFLIFLLSGISFLASAQKQLNTIVCDYAYGKGSILSDTSRSLFGYGDGMLDDGCSWKCNMRVITALSITGEVPTKDSLKNYNSASPCIIPSSIGKKIMYEVYLNGSVIMIDDTATSEDSVGVGLIGFVIANGNRKSKKEYSEYARLKKIELILDQKIIGYAFFKDTPKVQFLDMGKMYPLSFYKKLNLEIVIKEVYPGTKYDELAISELHLEGHGGHSLVGKFCWDELW